jgi:hypothetical protein
MEILKKEDFSILSKQELDNIKESIKVDILKGNTNYWVQLKLMKKIIDDLVEDDKDIKEHIISLIEKHEGKVQLSDKLSLSKVETKKYDFTRKDPMLDLLYKSLDDIKKSIKEKEDLLKEVLEPSTSKSIRLNIK